MMKKQISRYVSFLSIILMLMLSVPAMADHSVLPLKGDLDETQALDLAIGHLCGMLDLSEEEIRGNWFYSSQYMEKGVYIDEGTWEIVYTDGSAWNLGLVDPEKSGTYEITDYVRDQENGNEFGFREITIPWPVYRMYDVTISAKDGSLLNVRPREYRLPKREEEFQLILIPQKDQLQPQEALDRAYGLLSDALAIPEEEVKTAFRDYVLRASSAVGEKRCWYHVELNASGNLSRTKGFHVYLDMNSGEVIRQTDPGMIAGRFALWQQGLNHHTWYYEQLDAQEAEWGEQENWDYQQNAAFEKRCFGRSFNVINLAMGLPGEGECGLEEAQAAAQAILSETGDSWELIGSVFWTDAWGDMLERLSVFDTEPERLWQLNFVSSQGQGKQIFIDPVTCEEAEGAHG